MPNACLKRVMHVDDDSDIQGIAMLALREIGGLEVVQYSSGIEAIEAVVGCCPDVILLDVMMPGLSGEETFKEIRGMLNLATPPTIFMTAKSSQETVTRLLALGAAGVIVKPFNPILLAEEICEIYERIQSVD